MGGIAELPEVAWPLALNDRRTEGSWVTVLAAVGIGGAVLLAVADSLRTQAGRLTLRRSAEQLIL